MRWLDGLTDAMNINLGNPFLYSCLNNPKDRGAWWATAHGVTELDTTEQLSTSISKGAEEIVWVIY